MKIQRLEEFSLYDNMTKDFLGSFDEFIKESDENVYNKIQKKVISDLRLNGNLSLTFGTGIKALYPIVEKLMTNMKISSVDITPDTVVLLTICAFTIVYLEEKKFKDSDEEEILTKDSKSMLEELRMKGIGNGIVKKVVKILKSITGIFSLIGKHMDVIVNGFIDMFAYTAILIPIMNGILYIIGKYNLTIDSFLENFSALMMGIITITAKHGIKAIVDKIKDRISKKDKKNIIDDLEQNVIKKVGNFKTDNYDNDDTEMINEQ